MSSVEHLISNAKVQAREMLDTVSLDKVAVLGISKTHADLLGSHTVVTYPPLDALQEIDGNQILSNLSFQPQVDAYVHLPYCEYPCKFCPYTTILLQDASSGKSMPSYMDALKTEVTMWAQKLGEQGAKLKSLYVGGGTPFALPLEELEDVLSFVRGTLPFVDTPDICVETSPRATIGGDAQKKLEMLVAQGVTRMSIGIQSFDFASLRDMARTFKDHTPYDEEQAVRILLASGIPNINVDMIQDLPSPTGDYDGRLQHDLSKIAELKPQHVTWYNMRLRPETVYAKKRSPDVAERESLLTRLTLWQVMEQLGYQVLEGDRFALADQFEDTFRQTRGSVDTSLLGMGVSSYSHVGSSFFQNMRVTGGSVRGDSKLAVNQYIAAVERQGHGITTGFKMTDDELVAGKLALGLKKGVDLEGLLERFSSSPDAQAYIDRVLTPQVAALQEAGLVTLTDGQLTFTQAGRLFENEICARFYSPRVILSAHEKRGTATEQMRQDFGDYEMHQQVDTVLEGRRTSKLRRVASLAGLLTAAGLFAATVMALAPERSPEEFRRMQDAWLQSLMSSF